MKIPGKQINLGNGLSGTEQFAVTPANDSVLVNSSGVAGPIPVKRNKNITANTTTANGDKACNPVLSYTPAGDGYLKVKINGIKVSLGDGDKLHDCYFSDDNGVTAKNIADIAAGDTLHWNGSIAGYQLAPTDKIEIDYSAILYGVQAQGAGFTAGYYSGTDFQTLIFNRVDPQISFATPDSDDYEPTILTDPFFAQPWNLQGGLDIYNDDITVRWVCNAVFPVTTLYSFYLFLSGGCRIYVDGYLDPSADFWDPANGTQNGFIPSGALQLNLNAGQVYEFTVEYQTKAIFTTPPERWASFTVEAFGVTDRTPLSTSNFIV